MKTYAYVQDNSKYKNSILRSKSKNNHNKKNSKINNSKLSSTLTLSTTKNISQNEQQVKLNSNFLINKKYYKAAMIEYQKFNANSINWYLKRQLHNDYLNLVQVLKFYTTKQYLIQLQKVSAVQGIKQVIKNCKQEVNITQKCLHFNGICYHILKHRQHLYKALQKNQKLTSKKIVEEHPYFLNSLKKKVVAQNLQQQNRSRTKPIVSTDTLQLQKLSKYLNTIFKKGQTNKSNQGNHAKKSGNNSEIRFNDNLKQTFLIQQSKIKEREQYIQEGTLPPNQFRQIMQEQFSQINLKVHKYQDDCQLYGLSELKRKKKSKVDSSTGLQKNTSDTRTSKRFSTHLQMHLSKITSTPRKNTKSRSQHKNTLGQKSHSNSTRKSVSLKRQTSGTKLSSKQKKTNIGLGKGSQKYNKLTDTQRLLFNTDNDNEAISKKSGTKTKVIQSKADINNYANNDPPLQQKKKFKKIKSEREVNVNVNINTNTNAKIKNSIKKK